MLTCEERFARAQKILYGMGLLDYLAQIGAPHVVGSCRMNMMAWNDLDIDVENKEMSIDRLYDLTAWILKTFCPTWYEAKEEVNDEGRPSGFTALKPSLMAKSGTSTFGSLTGRRSIKLNATVTESRSRRSKRPAHARRSSPSSGS